MKVAICIGHSRKILNRIEGGSVSVGKMSEHTFNTDIADRLHKKLKDADVQSTIFDSYSGNGYTAAMHDAADKVKKYGSDATLELHFNDADPSATGFEYLYHEGSVKGKKLATALLEEHAKLFIKSKKRGAKSISADERGSQFLSLTHCPAVICEPFFGSNKDEWELYSSLVGRDRLAAAYAAGIIRYLNS